MKLYSPVRIAEGGYTNVGNLFGARPEIYAQFGHLGHNGNDFNSNKPLNQDVYIYATRDEFIDFLEDRDLNGNLVGYGKYARGRNAEGYTYLAHFKEFIGTSRQVRAGEKIGIMGSTGFSTGRHTHLTFKPANSNPNNGYGGAVDPQQFLTEEIPTMVEFVHKAGTQEYGFVESTAYTQVYYRGIDEADIKFQARKFGRMDIIVNNNIDFTKAKPIQLP